MCESVSFRVNGFIHFSGPAFLFPVTKRALQPGISQLKLNPATDQGLSRSRGAAGFHSPLSAKFTYSVSTDYPQKRGEMLYCQALKKGFQLLCRGPMLAAERP